MTYQATINNVTSRLKFGIKPGLERISELLRLLGNPQEKLKYAHIAGTNGKGSASTLIASVLTECGYKTGLFTSPYVMEFRERFQIDGKMIPEQELNRLAERVDAAAGLIEAKNGAVTEFEFITAVAFLWFYESDCDYVVLEVGLGGGLDCTNVISMSEVSVIMQIALDHTAILGDTVEQIAYQKAGIIKQGGTVILYPNQAPGIIRVVSDVCRTRNATLIQPELEQVEIKEASIHGTAFSYNGTELTTPFAGAHQVLNAVTAFEALRALKAKGVSLPRERLAKGFLKANIPARMEVFSQKPLIVIDGGHNPACAVALRKMLEDFTPGFHRVAVMGMMADKDVERTLKIVGPLFTKIIASSPDNPRAMPAAEFAEIARRYCKQVEISENNRLIAQSLLKIHDEKTVAVICGSLYLAGEFRNLLINDKNS